MTSTTAAASVPTSMSTTESRTPSLGDIGTDTDTATATALAASSSTSAASTSSSSVHSAARVGYSTPETTQAYEKGRPSYASECIDTMLSVMKLDIPTKTTTSSLHLLDVGCGTGIFFRELYFRLISSSIPLASSITLTGIEPVHQMIQQLHTTTLQKLPYAKWKKQDDNDAKHTSTMESDKHTSNVILDIVETDAEHLPYADNSIDGIFAAQAFHWFGTPAAVAELHRVLRPGSTLAMIWNTRDESISWVAELEKIIEPLYGRDGTPHQKNRAWQKSFHIFDAEHKLFTPLQHKEWTGDKRVMIQTGDIDMILARVMSISVIAQMSASEKQEIRERVVHVMHTHPQTRDLTTHHLPYRTDLFWVTKL